MSEKEQLVCWFLFDLNEYRQQFQSKFGREPTYIEENQARRAIQSMTAGYLASKSSEITQMYLSSQR